MTDETQEVVPPKKRMGRPPGSGKKKQLGLRDPNKLAEVALAVNAAGYTPTTVPLQELTDLANFIDYWKSRTNLTTLQCLQLYVR